MGKVGAPKGNRNSKRGLQVTNELVKALKQFELKSDDPKDYIKRGTAIRKIMDQVVQKALEGHEWAIQFIAERIEGKVTQKVEATSLVQHQITHIPIEFVQAIDVTPERELIGTDKVSH